MRVSQEDEIELSDIEVKRPLVLAGRLAASLEEAAVDQNTDALGVQQETGARDLAGSPKKTQFHTRSFAMSRSPSRPIRA